MKQSLGSSRVTIITRPPADVKSKIMFDPQAGGLQIVVTRLEPSDCRGNVLPTNYTNTSTSQPTAGS